MTSHEFPLIRTLLQSNNSLCRRRSETCFEPLCTFQTAADQHPPLCLGALADLRRCGSAGSRRPEPVGHKPSHSETKTEGRGEFFCRASDSPSASKKRSSPQQTCECAPSYVPTACCINCGRVQIEQRLHLLLGKSVREGRGVVQTP